MEDNKILIIWETRLDDGYIDKRQIVCKSKTSAKILCNRLANVKSSVIMSAQLTFCIIL